MIERVLCDAYVGPVPKLDDEVMLCAKAAGHDPVEGHMDAGRQTWWDDGVGGRGVARALAKASEFYR